MSDASTDRYDVAIVGGGMVGASLALALSHTSLRTLVIEAVAPDSTQQRSFDDRATALGNGARRILETLNAWNAIAPHAAAIREVHVSEAGRPGAARLTASEQGLDALGFTVSNRHIGAALWQALRSAPASRVTYMSPARVTGVTLGDESAQLRVKVRDTAGGETEAAVEARLVVAADGAHSLVKQAAGIESDERSYDQIAVVANVATDRPATGIAYERFVDSGPLAMMPRHDGSYTVIWALPQALAPSLRDGSAEEFARQLQDAFGWRAGRIVRCGQRGSYPLALVRAKASIGKRVAVIGNAAQTLHPVAAQGYNLGLRDAAVLAELIGSAQDAGANAVLEEFARRRAADRDGMIRFTDRLVMLFGSRRPTAVAARNLGLMLFDVTPMAKRALSRLSWGFGGSLPRLSRGLPLKP
jgi:2-octaprenyl-6-methoxyphenol hydroxylase